MANHTPASVRAMSDEELNRAIAEAKGEKPHMAFVEYEDGDGACMPTVKNCTGSWQHARPLLEEMADAMGLFDAYSMVFKQCRKGITTTRTICEAWLVWKGGV